MLNRSEDDELELRHYAQVVWRRRAILIAVVLVLVALSIVYDFVAKPVYRASTDVLLQGNPAEKIFTVTPDGQRTSAVDKAQVATEIKIVQSKTVRAAAEKALGGTAKVSVNQSGDSDVISISSQGNDPDRAAHVAQTYSETYVNTRRQQLTQSYADA